MKTLIAVIFSSIAFGQTLIHSGSADDAYFSPSNTCAAGGTCAYTDTTVIPSTLRYGYGGTSLKYDIPAPMGLGIIYLGFYEPNKTNVGQRVFTVSINGGTPITLDIYKLAGASKKYWVMPPQAVVVTDGFTHISLVSKVGNPLISTIDYKPNGLKGDQGIQGIQGIQGVPGNDGKNGVAITLPTMIPMNCIRATATAPGIKCTINMSTNTVTVEFEPQIITPAPPQGTLFDPTKAPIDAVIAQERIIPIGPIVWISPK